MELKIEYMRRLISVLLCAVCHIVAMAHVIENPIFDMTHSPNFRINKIIISPDTTYLFCTCFISGTWVNISKSTYIEDIESMNRYNIIKSEGLPFGPDKIEVIGDSLINAVLYFPRITGSKVNFIEDENSYAFNIYGININESYKSTYTDRDIDEFRELAVKEDTSGNWDASIDYSLKQLEASDYVYGKRSFPSAWSMYNLTMEYAQLENQEFAARKMIEWGEKAIDILNNVSAYNLRLDSINLDVLARAYGNTSTAFTQLGQSDSASYYMDKSLDIRRNLGKVNGLDYEEYLMHMARNSFFEEKYPQAYLYAKESSDIYEKKYNENQLFYGCLYLNTLSYLCNFAEKIGKYEESINYGNKVLALLNSNVCPDKKSQEILYASTCTGLACAYSQIAQNDKSIEILESFLDTKQEYGRMSIRMLLAEQLLNCRKDTTKVIQEYKSILKTLEDSISVGKYNYPDYSEILHKLAIVYMKKDIDSTIHYFDKYIEVQKKWNGEESIAYGNSLFEYIQWLSPIIILKKSQEIEKVQSYLYQSANIIKRHFNNSIPFLSKRDRKNYWQHYKFLFTEWIPIINRILKTDISYSIAYDAALFYKGMLLSSELEFKNVLLSSEDKTLKELYESYSHNLALIENLYSTNSNTSLVDSLKSVISSQEYLLSQKVSRSYREFKGTNFSWQDVRGKLSDKDVAIEIVSYKTLVDTITYYDAYILKKGISAPILIPLFEENQLKNYVSNGKVDYMGISSLLWANEDMKEVLKGKKNIYFSTSGLLNQIGIEYLPISDEKYIYDIYNLYRLSSTRELCMMDDIHNIVCAYIYGGLDYNASVENDGNGNIINDSKVGVSVIRSLKQRGGFDYLAGSKDEILKVSQELQNNNIDCTVYTAEKGTEESIKKLSGSIVNALHISTHGICISIDNDSVFQKNNLPVLTPDENKDIDEEEMSLSRSFLVMSGGNLLIRRDSIPEGKDDGLLTALEISHLDFLNLDLVVLSACQTALGDVDSEGVYGLQRGFKKAGAKSILMSLDNVDDEATRILMVEFYRNLMSGKTKHQSLKDAQKYLRQVENGKYDKPEYWASFIMLDGLN